MYSNAAQAYRSTEKATLNGRSLEAHVLNTAAIKLKECQNNWEGKDSYARLVEALKLNQKVWSIFQVELSAEDNPLPKQLRIDLLRLGRFIDQRIMDIMAFPEAEKLTAIININNNIAAGLQGNPGGTTPV